MTLKQFKDFSSKFFSRVLEEEPRTAFLTLGYSQIPHLTPTVVILNDLLILETPYFQTPGDATATAKQVRTRLGGIYCTLKRDTPTPVISVI